MKQFVAATLFLCTPLAANDVVFLHGRVVMGDGAAPGKSIVIEVQCRGVDPVKQTVAGKDGKFNWKVERDDFNHIARALPATATDIENGGILSGACELRASLKGFASSSIDLRDFVIGKDLTLPNLILKPKPAGK